MRVAERAFAVALALCVSGCAGSHYEPPKSRFELDPGGKTFEPEAKWREGDVRFPAYPDDRNLVEFAVDGQSNNHFFIDSKSLSSDPDGVIRYTVIVRSNAGAENILYEGIRCNTREWKPYAFSGSGRTWSPARDPQWQNIAWQTTNGFRYALYHDHFCPDGYPVSNPLQALIGPPRPLPR